MRRKRILATLSGAAMAVGLSNSASAQLTITMDGGAMTPMDMVDELVDPGSGIVISPGASFIGADIQVGMFTGGASVFGPFVDSGLVLSSGDVHGDSGALNNSSSFGFDHPFAPGDPDLDLLTLFGPGSTQDAAVLEFEFTCPTVQEVSFLFVFTSEEYNEFVDSIFNDVFAFYVDGVNVALVPVVGLPPISINTVNNGFNNDGVGATNPGFFIANRADLGVSAMLPIQMDGLTVVMAATATLNANPTHTMKLAIADTSDGILDSAVYIAASTFTCGDPLVVELDHFRAGRTGHGGNVFLSWATLSEVDNAGFNIYREPWTGRPSATPGLGATLVNPLSMIPAQGNIFSATPYRWLDRTAELGVKYSYWLEDVDIHGISTLHGPVTVN